MKIISGPWNYISDIWQGDDGKLSLKRVFVISLAVEVIRMLEGNKIANDQTLSAFYAILGTICVVLGIVTVQQVQNLKLPSIISKRVTEETTTKTGPDAIAPTE